MVLMDTLDGKNLKGMAMRVRMGSRSARLLHCSSSSRRILMLVIMLLLVSQFLLHIGLGL